MPHRRARLGTLRPVEPDTYTVVVVDDADDVRGVVGRQLRLNERFTVVAEGATGADAIELAAVHQPDVVVLDASMPDIDGLEALPRILEVSPGSKVVMLSGFGAAALEQAARDRGAAAFVEKAAPLRDLPDRLLRLLEPVTSPAPAPAMEASERLAVAAALDLAQDAAGRESVLAEHLERFRTVFDQAAIGMATMTLTGTIVRVNAALVQVTGESESGLSGRRYFELAEPESREALRDAIIRLGRGEVPVVEVEHRLAGGTGCWVRSTVTAVTDADGRPLYLFAQAEDITERREVLEALRVSEERFRLLVESVTDYAIFMLDPEGHITTWNAGAERMKGYQADAIIGQHFRVFYPPEKQATGHPEHELQLAIRDGCYEEEGWRVRQDGTRFWANVVITALFDRDRNLVGFGKVTRDMSERRRAEEARERAAAILAEANEKLRAARQEAVNALDITAHELQSPISVMTGAAAIIAEHWEQLDPDDRAESLRNIMSSATRARRFLEDLLLASRLEAGSLDFRLESVDLGSAIREAIGSVPPAPDAVEVVGTDGFRVTADRTRLVQMVTNLVSNARKYGAPPIVVEARGTGSGVEVHVRDNGPGIPEDLEHRLFRTKFLRGPGRPDRGSGLGLFIVAELARRQNGEAWYERHDGRACFAFWLATPGPSPTLSGAPEG